MSKIVEDFERIEEFRFQEKLPRRRSVVESPVLSYNPVLDKSVHDRNFGSLYSEIRRILYTSNHWESDHEILHPGVPCTSTVVAGSYKYFRFPIADEEIVAINAENLSGDLELCMCSVNEYPSKDKRTWSASLKGGSSCRFLIPPSDPGFRAAHPLFIGVLGSENSEFRLHISHSEHRTLIDSKEDHGKIKEDENKFYRVKFTDPKLPITIELITHEGDADLCVDTRELFPSKESCIWQSGEKGSDRVNIATSDEHFHPGWYYITVVGQTPKCSYTLLASTRKGKSFTWRDAKTSRTRLRAWHAPGGMPFDIDRNLMSLLNRPESAPADIQSMTTLSPSPSRPPSRASRPQSVPASYGSSTHLLAASTSEGGFLSPPPAKQISTETVSLSQTQQLAPPVVVQPSLSASASAPAILITPFAALSRPAPKAVCLGNTFPKVDDLSTASPVDIVAARLACLSGAKAIVKRKDVMFAISQIAKEARAERQKVRKKHVQMPSATSVSSTTYTSIMLEEIHQRMEQEPAPWNHHRTEQKATPPTATKVLSAPLPACFNPQPPASASLARVQPVPAVPSAEMSKEVTKEDNHRTPKKEPFSEHPFPTITPSPARAIPVVCRRVSISPSVNSLGAMLSRRSSSSLNERRSSTSLNERRSSTSLSMSAMSMSQSRRPSGIGLPESEERLLVLLETEPPVKPEESVLGLFEPQTALQPDVTAFLPSMNVSADAAPRFS